MGKEISEAEKLRAFMNAGGARQKRFGAVGEVYSTQGERDTAAGVGTIVSTLLAPFLTGERDVAQRVKLTARQRGVGNCYGAYCEMAVSGGGSEFLKVKVDTSTTNGGGHTANQVQVIRMADEAKRALAALPMVRYARGSARGNDPVGRHAPIRAAQLVDAVCISGWSLTVIGLSHGWTTDRRDKATGRLITGVPDRQRKALAEALRTALDAIDIAWQAKGYDIPFAFMQVEVR